MTLTVTNSPSVRLYKAAETYVVNAWIARAQKNPENRLKLKLKTLS